MQCLTTGCENRKKTKKWESSYETVNFADIFVSCFHHYEAKLDESLALYITIPWSFENQWQTCFLAELLLESGEIFTDGSFPSNNIRILPSRWEQWWFSCGSNASCTSSNLERKSSCWHATWQRNNCRTGIDADKGTFSSELYYVMYNECHYNNIFMVSWCTAWARWYVGWNSSISTLANGRGCKGTKNDSQSTETFES